MSGHGYPRPHKTLLIAGWRIAEGEVQKVGLARVSDSDDPNGVVLVTDSHFSWPGARDDLSVLMPVINAMILARPDVLEMLAED